MHECALILPQRFQSFLPQIDPSITIMGMLYRLALVLFFLTSQPGQSAIPAQRVIARVNGTPIYEDELKKFEDYRTASRADLIERAVLFHLAVDQAKKSGLEKEAHIQKELDKLLYQEYLSSLSKEKKAQLLPTEKQIETFYKENPLLRVNHLVLLLDSPEKRKAAPKLLKKIQRELAKKVPFHRLILKYSEDDSARFGGELDFRGPHDLPPEIYQALKKLKSGVVSKPITLPHSIHLVRWTEKKSFSKAPETYLAYIRSKIRKEKEMVALSSALKNLKKEARVEIVGENTAK